MESRLRLFPMAQIPGFVLAGDPATVQLLLLGPCG